MTRLVLSTSLAAIVACSGGDTAGRQLRVCADPNNLPFSNEEEAGFENRLAELLASDLGAELRYTWWAQRRGFFRNTLNAGLCDVVLGVPGNFELAAYIAGQLPHDAENLVRWIQDPQAIEPGTAMPNLGVVPSVARDMAAYLYTLQ
jgi:hypothetical protein